MWKVCHFLGMTGRPGQNGGGYRNHVTLLKSEHASGTANSKRIPHQQLLGQEGLSLLHHVRKLSTGSIDLAVQHSCTGLEIPSALSSVNTSKGCPLPKVRKDRDDTQTCSAGRCKLG